MESKRKPDEVVLVIIGGEEQGAVADRPAAAHELESHYKGGEDLGSRTNPRCPHSGEIALSTSSSPSRLPPKPPHPETLVRRRTLSKPKSRFVEQTLPPPPIPPSESGKLTSRSSSRGSPVASATPREGSKSGGGGASPKVTTGDEDEEDDEEEVYRKVESRKNGSRRGKFRRARVLFEWVVLVLAIGCLVTSLKVRRLQGFVIWGLEIWKWCVMAIVICCGRLLTHWFVAFVVFLIERNFLFKKKVLYFVYGLKNSFQVCIWLSLVLLTWSILFNRGVERTADTNKILNYVSRALASLLIGSVLWLVKTLLVKLLAASFHVNTFFDRIQESVFHQYVLQTLLGRPVMELAEETGSAKISKQLSFKNVGEGKKQEQGKIDVGKLHRMSPEKVSAGTMTALIAAVRGSGFLTISNVIDDSITEDQGAGKKEEEITNEWEAKTVGFRIFKNVAKPCYRYIEEEDLLRFLSKEEVELLLPMFQGAAETGRITKKALKNWVVKAYLDRKALAHSLNDTKTAVKQIHKLATFLVSIVIIIIALLLMGFATTQVLVLISSQLLLVAFMFGNTCKTIFEAIIFVFVMHPFDVGDRCVIDGVQMTVEEMNILTTVFLRYDNEKIYYPNSVLATKPISNFYRSPDMNDCVEFSIDVFTSMEVIAAMKARIKSYIDSKPLYWHPNHSVIVKDIVNINKMNLALNVLHTMNFQNIPQKNFRRTELVLELKKIFEELSIRYNLLPQDVHLSYICQGTPPLP